MTDQDLQSIFSKTDAALASLVKVQTESQMRADAQQLKTEQALTELSHAQAKSEAEALIFRKEQTELLKTQAELRKEQAELRKEQAEQSRQMQVNLQETRNLIKAVHEQMGGISKSQGMVTEEFFYNSLKANPRVAGIQFEDVLPRLTKARDGKEVEIDVFLENGTSIALAEVKYRVRSTDVEQVQKTVAGFRELFPKYKDYTLYAGVAGFSFEQEAIDLAHAQGLFILKRKGDVIESESSPLKTF